MKVRTSKVKILLLTSIACVLVVVGVLIVFFINGKSHASSTIIQHNLNPDDVSSMSGGTVAMKLETDIELRANYGDSITKANIKVPSTFTQGNLSIKSIDLSNGIKIVTPSGYYEISSVEILECAGSKTVEETELWMADSIEHYLGGWNDVVIEIHSLEPLKITPTISKRSVNKYEEETVD